MGSRGWLAAAGGWGGMLCGCRGCAVMGVWWVGWVLKVAIQGGERIG